MKERKVSAARIIMLLLPVVSAVLLLVPAFNPGRFISFTADWTYLATLRDAMQVDQLFTKAFPGVRVLFASNAQLLFCTFALGVGVAVQLAGMIISLLRQKQISILGTVIAFAGGIITLVTGALSVFGAMDAMKVAAAQNVAAEYLVPLGSVVLLLEGAAMCVMFFITRRQRMVADKTYMRMTRSEIRENIKGYAFISPYLIGFCVFTAFPLVFSAFSSSAFFFCPSSDFISSVRPLVK